MNCDNCHELADLREVHIGSFIEQWCSFCVEQGAVKCSECDRLLDIDTAFHAGSGAGLFYFCSFHRNRPLLRMRPQIEREMCCEPDFRDGRSVHQDGCHGSVEANKEAEEMK